jgi:uncharacterized protein YegP (UPF0339 family)
MKFKTYTVTVYKAADGWRWRMKAANGRTVADSGEAYSGEAYSTKRGAERAAYTMIDAEIIVNTN